MIKKTITYENFNDETVTEDFYFNMNKLEIMELELSMDGGVEKTLERLTQTQDGSEAYLLFKDVVLATYGKKSPDGKRFEKSDEIRREFAESPALGELIFGFIKNPSEAAAFIQGTMPAKLVAEVSKEASDPGQPQLQFGGEITTSDTSAGVTTAPVAPDEDKPAWLRENRRPTPRELQAMDKQEMALAMLHQQKTAQA